MKLHVEQGGTALLVRVEESRIDAAIAIRFKDAMREVAGPNAAPAGVERVVLDLSNVAFLDSSGLGAVVAVMKELGPKRPLELAALTPAVDRVFRLTRMDSVFTIHPSARDTLRNVG